MAADFCQRPLFNIQFQFEFKSQRRKKDESEMCKAWAEPKLTFNDLFQPIPGAQWLVF